MLDKPVRIGVVSDSHGHMPSLELALRIMGSVDLVIHAGDSIRDSRELSRRSSVPIIGVAGNCDSPHNPQEEIVELYGQRFYITHGHIFGVKSGRSELVRVARRHAVDVAVYGHTHMPALYMEYGILFVNPGSTLIGRNGTTAGYAVLTVQGMTINGALCSLPNMSK